MLSLADGALRAPRPGAPVRPVWFQRSGPGVSRWPPLRPRRHSPGDGRHGFSTARLVRRSPNCARAGRSPTASSPRRPDARRRCELRGLRTRCNPIAIAIPCHRVIGKDSSLTGYGGGLWRKRWLLEHEGACSSVDPIDPDSHRAPTLTEAACIPHQTERLTDALERPRPTPWSPPARPTSRTSPAFSKPVGAGYPGHGPSACSRATADRADRPCSADAATAISHATDVDHVVAYGDLSDMSADDVTDR